MSQEISRDLPNIPEEVVRLWVIPLAEKEGWPPRQNNNWDVRVTGETFSFWNDAEWEQTNLDLSQIEYSRGYHDTMRGLRDAYVLGVQNDYWRLLGDDGKRRFHRCSSYIARNRTFPVPPVLAPNEVGRYDVLDGNHRFLAYIFVENAHAEYERASQTQRHDIIASMGGTDFQPPHAIQQVWVCKPKWENSERAQTRNYFRNNGLDFF